MKFQTLFMLIYLGIYIPIFFIPYGIGIEILPNGTQLSPVWSLGLTIFLLILLSTQLLLILIISINVYKKFNTNILAEKFKFFVIGVIFLYYIPIGVTITNYLNIQLLRIIFGFTAPIIIVGLILIYYGIGKPINIKVS
ncbi:MAG: hypothetical protein P8Y97_12445 [Candidatus Lokiarchaeota archaeon]